MISSFFSRSFFHFIVFLLVAGPLGCSSTRDVKQQSYAELKDEQTFEYEFPVVWKAIESVVKDYRVTDRDPEEVTALEMKKLTERSLKTDWIYARSNEKYVEYQVNGFPRKKYLQTRYQLEISAHSQMGGVTVHVQLQEELEHLNEDGTSAGYQTSDDPDRTLPNQFLKKIENAILSQN